LLVKLLIISILIAALITVTPTALVSAAKAKITFTDFGNYHGNVKVKLTNLDGHVTLIKEGVSFSNAGSRLTKTFTFDSHGSLDGDKLQLHVTGNGGSWTFSETYKDNVNIGASLDEISDGDDYNVKNHNKNDNKKTGDNKNDNKKTDDNKNDNNKNDNNKNDNNHDNKNDNNHDNKNDNNMGSQLKQSNSITPTYSLMSSWGYSGTGDGQMIEPADLSIDTSNNIVFVADKDNNRIQKFDINGTYLGKWGTFGSGNGQFDSPGDVIVDSTNKRVYVADIGNNRIEKFDLNGKFISMWGAAGRSSGQFNQPGDIAIDVQDELLFVVDIGNHRVQKFDLDGHYNSSWGYLGSGDGQLDRPAGIAYDSLNKIVYVADTNNNRIQKFDISGKFLGKWGSGDGQFNGPVSVAVEPGTNNVFVVDTGNKQIQKLDSNGNFILEWGHNGKSPGLFARPNGIAIDNNGRVLILDKDNNNVQTFLVSDIHGASQTNKESNFSSS